MKQALQLGFKGFQNLTSFAATPRHWKIGTLVFFRVRAMGSKRALSNSSIPVSKGIEDKEDKKLKGLVGASPNSEKAVVKKCDDVVGIQSIKDDQARIEAMTVQELRTTLRSVGIPAKGCKRDLVSALKCFMDKKMEGEGSQEAGEHISSICIESISLKKKVNSSSDENSIQDISTVMEVSAPEQGQRKVRRRQKISNGEAIEVSVKNVTQKQKLSINTDGVSGNKPSFAKRKISSEIGSEDAVANDGFNLAMNQTEPWTIFAHKKPQKGWTVYNPRIMRPPPLSGDTKFVKLMSWNVNGLRALLKLEGFSALQLAQREDFDVLCLQETKLQEKDVQAIKQCLIDGYENSFWTCSVSKLGYSGTAIISRIKPLSVRYGLGISDHDSEGRLVTAEFDSFYLISGYVPNSGDGLRRLSYRVTEWDSSLSNYLKELEKSKPVILTGDLNCAHEEIDIYDPAGNKRSAGFTAEERESFKTNFLSRGFVDTFRMQHPNVVGYTYWGYRHGARKTNRGWRLDYFLVSESIADKVHDSYILPDVNGSDHCPIGLVLKH